jgi:3D (Asp-Asp-Asp) domain-containing protein
LLLLFAGLLLAGCATERPLPTWEPPLAKTEFQRVRTTAYFDGESDHIRYGNHNALGTCLRYGPICSAAADWSRWPAGTVFRLLPGGRTYIVDDYGWDLAGRNTIDLYMPTRSQMDDWGLRYMDIQVLRWGDPRASYEAMRKCAGYRHVARMMDEIRPQLDEGSEVAMVSQPQPMAPAAPVPVAVAVARPRYIQPPAPGSVVLQPFLAGRGD